MIWLVAQLPQLIETYQNKTVDGISPYFLAIWLVGDITSFIGCVFTEQMYFQYVISLYFLLNDVILCGQYYYYEYYYHKKHTRHHHLHHHRQSGSYGSSSQDIIRAALPASIIASNIGSSEALPILFNFNSNSASALKYVNTEAVGLWCAWIGAACYFFSRVPQLIKNYHRKSTQDLSPFLFVCTLAGNSTYGLSIVLSCQFLYNVGHRWEFFLNELPYLIGSAGTIVFDIFYFYQVWLYREVKFEGGSESEESETAPLLSDS